MKLKTPFMNAAYIGSKTLEDVEALVQTPSGAVVVGSISVKPRQPNAGAGYWRHPDHSYSLNSFGMPNGGLPYFTRALPAMVKIAHAHHKPLIANLIGFTNAEFGRLIELAESAGADMVELNLGCPNVWDGGTQKQILSYHPPLVKDTLEYIARLRPKIPIGVKLSPLPPDTLREVAVVIADAGVVQAVTATNSYPNALTSSGTQVGGEQTLAGLTGHALKPISLGVVYQLRRMLPDSIEIIGCGSVRTTRDVNDYLAAGAKAVQIATALMDEGPTVFDRLV